VIPRDYITEWRAEAPWVQDFQIEQDLVISRALVELFSHPLLQKALAFRGGTALYKLHFTPAARYSEDVDLVQVRAGPAGPMMSAVRGILDPWLGKPKWKQTDGRVAFVYRFDSEEMPPIPLRLKVEINTREHFCMYGLKQIPFIVASRWFHGSCKIQSYDLDELLATKLRALYQRKQGRDLFDLATALKDPRVDPARIVTAFSEYTDQEGLKVTRAQFEENFALKMRDPQFLADIRPLLAAGYQWDAEAAALLVSSRLIERLPGDAWKRNL
jgi:predicted nucleotidyltransferase component of viral defense system